MTRHEHQFIFFFNFLSIINPSEKASTMESRGHSYGPTYLAANGGCRGYPDAHAADARQERYQHTNIRRVATITIIERILSQMV
jgi:hypothetical protein